MCRGIEFSLADESHDPAIRRLLRESSMDGRIRLSLQREPSFFRSMEVEGAECHTIIARHEGQVVGMGSVSVRERYFNGRPMRVGYLSGLRLAHSCRGRFDVLRRGYERLGELLKRVNPAFCLTSIAQDNRRAIRLLERGLPGMPTYQHVGNLRTLLIRVPMTLRYLAELPRVPDHTSLDHLDDDAGQYQFAPVWRSELRRHVELRHFDYDSFQSSIDGERLVHCAAVWDQRPLRQAVVAGYSLALSFLRPFYNTFAWATGGVSLPPVGTAIPMAFISHLACPADPPQLLHSLITSCAAVAARKGIRYLTLGFDHRDLRLRELEANFRPWTYDTRLYQVFWPGQDRVEPPDERLMYPEVALL